ncbi:MAG: DUF2865 domain-containing protein [Hyphomicrobiaceae bacterium]|nr:DUF2865 domain-containing protein [Hyphomicrobiaceae bacterium]
MRAVVLAGLAVICAAGSAAERSAHAQGFGWPWESNERPAPVPREPVYREPARPAPEPSDGGWSTSQGGQQNSGRSSICLRLEQRLVQESQGGNKAREQLPQVENDLRQAQRDLRKLERDLDRADCYEWFLFSKQLRNTRVCRKAVNDVDEVKRRIADLEGQRHEIQSTSGRSYQDEIIRELARNNCGSSYQQEARRRDGGSFSGLWQDEDSAASSSANGFRALPFATYRTVCVRLCDGYYFPVSFSTLPNHFQRDAEVCQSKCAAPAQLYYYQNPGGAVDQMVAFDNNQQYTKLKTAFLYRKEYISGCSCKQAEYVPQTAIPGGRKADASGAGLPPPATTGSTERAPTSVGDAMDPWRPR